MSYELLFFILSTTFVLCYLAISRAPSFFRSTHYCTRLLHGPRPSNSVFPRDGDHPNRELSEHRTEKEESVPIRKQLQSHTFPSL